MNLEKYKPQMSQQYPNTAFVEETLDNLKNRRARSRIPFKKIGKAVGAASLLTAAAFAVLVGVGAMRDTLLVDSITVQDPEEEQANLAEREAFMTPLSNPDHNVRISTEDGPVALNENSTAAEIAACGGVIDSEYGFVGYEKICHFLRAYRNGEAAELVIAELPTEYRPDRRAYQYIGLNEDGTVNGKYYEHKGEYLSTFPFGRAGQTTSYGIQFGYFAASSAVEPVGDREDYRSAVGGMAIDLGSFGRGGSEMALARNFIPICTISDLLKVSERDGDTIRAEYFDVFSDLGEKEGVNILWNGQYSTPAQLELFLTRIENGASYCSTTITDLTKTDEVEECFYALEYLDGVYRIFTMKNGFDGECGTALFDGYTVEDGMLVFNNGSVEYRFPTVEGKLDKLFVSVNPEEKRYIGGDAGVYRSSNGLARGNWVVRCTVGSWSDSIYDNDDKGGFTLYGTGNSSLRFEPLCVDPNDVARFASDPSNLMKISEEYSEGDRFAAEIVKTFELHGDKIGVTLALPEQTGRIEVAGNTELWLVEETCDIREMPDGKSYLMLTEAEWLSMTSMRAHTLDAEKGQLEFLAYNYK